MGVPRPKMRGDLLAHTRRMLRAGVLLRRPKWFSAVELNPPIRDHITGGKVPLLISETDDLTEEFLKRHPAFVGELHPYRDQNKTLANLFVKEWSRLMREENLPREEAYTQLCHRFAEERERFQKGHKDVSELARAEGLRPLIGSFVEARRKEMPEQILYMMKIVDLQRERTRALRLFQQREEKLQIIDAKKQQLLVEDLGKGGGGAGTRGQGKQMEKGDALYGLLKRKDNRE